MIWVRFSAREYEELILRPATGAKNSVWFCEASQMGAAPLISRLREQWAAVHPGVKFSAGVAVWDRSEGPQALLARSDSALYDSKEQGRDRTTVASALVI